jgi:hypothetical protein
MAAQPRFSAAAQFGAESSIEFKLTSYSVEVKRPPHNQHESMKKHCFGSCTSASDIALSKIALCGLHCNGKTV